MAGRLKKRKTVLVGGTFQYIHPGHIHLLKEASRLGDVNVVVSRDGNAKKHGRKIIVPEKLRLEAVRSLRLVKKAVLGGKKGILGGVRKINPDIIFLGPDQPSWRIILKILKQGGLEKLPKAVRLKRKLGAWSSRSIIDSFGKED